MWSHAGSEVPDQRPGAWAQDAADLGQAGRRVGPVVHRQRTDDQVEGPVGERQRGYVALQLVIEYDPRPPYDSGSLEKAEPGTKQRATELLTQGVA
jgi:hypothetical protein